MSDKVQQGVIVLDPMKEQMGKQRSVIPHVKGIILRINSLMQSAAVLEMDDSKSDLNKLIFGLQKSRTELNELIQALRVLKHKL